MYPSPLLQMYRDARAPLLCWGQSDLVTSENGAATDAGAIVGIDVPAALGAIELEYAAIKKHCALLDLPMRATLEVRGPDAIDFLNRMVTQELMPKGGSATQGRMLRSFWLNRKGRIDADLRIMRLENRVMLELDALAADRALRGIGSFIITEDCDLRDATQATHRLALHGPTSWELLRLASGDGAGDTNGDSLQALSEAMIDPDACIEASLAGTSCVICRDDTAGVPGFELVVPSHAVKQVVSRLIELGHDATHADFSAAERAVALRQARDPASHIRLLPIGWHAYNIARVETKTPLYNIDFGLESLPAETGERILRDRVSFTKGCYLGQEVVARMHARKVTKQSLMFVRLNAGTGSSDSYPPVPATGANVRATTPTGEQPVGTITSAVPSPQRSMAPVALAQIKSGWPVGTVVKIEAEGVMLTGTLEAI